MMNKDVVVGSALPSRRRIHVGCLFALLLIAATAGCTAGTSGNPAQLGPGQFVGFAEDAARPASLAYRPVALDIPECGFSIGVPAEWPVSRERRTRDDGRRSLTVTVKTPEIGSEARDRFFSHALDRSTVDPPASIIIECFENRTGWSPRRFAERYAQDSDTVRAVEEIALSGGAPAGLALTSDTDPARPTRRTRPYLVWKIRDGLWGRVSALIIEHDPAERHVATYPCGALVNPRTTVGGRWIAAHPELAGEELNRRANAELPRHQLVEWVDAVEAWVACTKAVRDANGLAEGEALRFERSPALNDSWFRDVIATIRPSPSGPDGFDGDS